MILHSVQKVATQLSVSPKTVRRLIAAEQLGCHKVGRRVLVSESQVREFVSSTEKAPEEKQPVRKLIPHPIYDIYQTDIR